MGVTPATHLVFVYGTLKRGQTHHHLLATARFAGEAQALGLSLHDLGPFPMAIAAAQPETGAETDPETVPVSGDVFAVDDETLEQLEQLDRLEGVPRLYQRQQLELLDGRRVWIYLGQPHQVRHRPALATGRWPALLLLISALIPALLVPASLQAATGLAVCNRWHSSHGLARLELGNQIGAVHYLTKMQRLQQSPPEAPVALYAESDLERACDSAR